MLNYGAYATGWITPEYGFWKNMNDIQALDSEKYLTAMIDTYDILSVRCLYNAKAFKDAILDYILLPSYFPNF